MSWPPVDPPPPVVVTSEVRPPASRPRAPRAPAWWERILLGLLAAGAGVFMAWLSLCWKLLLGFASYVPCGADSLGVVLVGVPGAFLVGLGWTLVVSLLLTAVRRRGVTGGWWLAAPTVLLAFVSYLAIATARAPVPNVPLEPGACSVYE